MSKISLDLSSIKSAGIYTIEIDESQRIETQVSALRLLVGFAGKGPFNRPVYIQNDAQRQKLFGDIDSKLEKKGCFFNRAAQTMLENSPILALNLLKVDDSYDGPDQVNYVALSLDAGAKNPAVTDPGLVYGEVDYLADTIDNEIYGTSTGNVIPFVGKAPYASMFDRSRFWIPSAANLMQVASVGLGVAGKTMVGNFEKSNFINFANTGTDEVSLLVYKPEGFAGYDVTAKDWYGGEENIPFGWIRPSDYMSDYFIRVVAVKGNWSNYPILSSDSTWGNYFDSKGIRKDKIFQFSQAEGVTFIGSWTGSIIPDFTDKQGNYWYILDKVNAQTESTGILMTINEDAMQVISYDKNGVDLTTGQQTGTGCWVYDYDGNNEADSDAGESEIGENGFLIDMVGHNFRNGVAGGSKSKISELTKKYKSIIFDASTGNLDGSVYYLDNASVGTAKENASVKYPKIVTETKSAGDYNAASGSALRLYPVYDASTNRIIELKEGGYKYVAISADRAESISDASIKALKIYTENGTANASTVSQALPAGVTSVKINKKSYKDFYENASVFYGNYASMNTSTKQVYVYSVRNGADNTPEVVDETIVDMTTQVPVGVKIPDTATTDSSVYTFYYNGKEYLINASTGTLPKGNIYTRTTDNSAKKYGINFLSYNYVSNSADDNNVTCNVRNAYYFNGQKNSSTINDPVTLADTSTFFNENPVPKDIRNMFIVTTLDDAAEITVGDFVENIAINNNNGDATKFGIIPGITRVTKKIFVNLTSSNVFTYGGQTYKYDATKGVISTKNGKRGFYLFTTIDPVYISNSNIIRRQLPISSDAISKSLRFIPLKGLHISARHRPGYDENGRISINEGIKKIYSVLEDEGIQRGLCNSNMVDYRYIVDSMSYGLDDNLGGKVYLARLAYNREKTTALLNAPSKHQFEISSDPCFCATYDANTYVKPSFSTKYIAEGGNPDMYSTKMFSVINTEANGSKYSAVFFPHLIYRENGHNIIVPPAADISNTFMHKFQGGDPYAIVANMDGVISNNKVIGLECDLDTEDRDYLEPIGINSLIRENNIIKIYGNQTCYQETKSDFNKLNTRETLNTLEIAVYNVLKTYNFKYNNPQTRASIVTAITPILEAMKLSGAIDWYELICDETNNTAEIIDQYLGIVDINVVVGHGMERIVNRIRLRKHTDIPA